MNSWEDAARSANDAVHRWRLGRLLGESALDDRRVFPRHRMGDFSPTEAGNRVMPIATGVSMERVDLRDAEFLRFGNVRTRVFYCGGLGR